MTARSLEYRPHLDGLRAIAVLLVFIFHAARPGLPGGFIGVDIFFVLSGYLITRILLIQYEKHGRIRIADFYARRIRRLMPAVILVVMVVVLHEALWGSILEATARLRDAIGTLFYFENWNLIYQADQYFAESLSASPLRHAWSLSIEEQFYLVWPLALIAILALTRRRMGRSTLVVLAAAAASALAMALLFEPQLVARAYYRTDARVQQPLIGAALAFLVVRSSNNWRTATKPWVWTATATATLGLLLIMARLFTGGSNFYYRGGSTLVALTSAALVYSLERSPGGWAAAGLLGWRPLQQLGRISYGFYLWHWPIILWLAVPAGFSFWERRAVNLAQFGLTVAISMASFFILESPIRDQTIRLGKLNSRTTIAFGLGTIVLAGVFSVAALRTDDSTAVVAGPDVPGTESASGGDSSASGDFAALAERAAADRSYEPCPDNPQPCVKVEGRTSDSPTVVLIGDSTAQAYDPALKDLATRYGFRYVQAAVGGCPISHRLIATGLDGELHKPSNFMCYDEMPGIYDEILAEYDPILFIATSWNETNQHVENGVLLEKGTPQHLASTQAALLATMDLLTSQGAQVAFIDVLPPGMSVDCLQDGGPGSAGCIRPVTNASGEAPYNALFHKIAEQRSDVVAISLTDIICPNNECPLMIDGEVMRYDGGHLTATASRRLTPTLHDRLLEAGVDLAALGEGVSAGSG